MTDSEVIKRLQMHYPDNAFVINVFPDGVRKLVINGIFSNTKYLWDNETVSKMGNSKDLFEVMYEAIKYNVEKILDQRRNKMEL